jgi:thiamine-phosphate pyrophosphorylase
VGLAYVAAAAARCPIPFFAIGGIDTANLPAVIAAGASRVAVVRAIGGAADPGAAAADLLTRLGQAADGDGGAVAPGEGGADG